MPSKEEELALMSRIASGSVEAMRAAYEAHNDAAMRFIMTRVRDPFEAADIAHEVMLDIWRGASAFQGRSSLRSWILSIARNKAIDHIRKHSRQELREPDQQQPDDAPSADTIIAASQDAKRVRDCIGKLPASQRAAIQLSFFDDLNYAEIAEIEQRPLNTIKTRMFHAKQNLRRCLGGDLRTR
ncbi:RNA polymerase sigma factor [Oricola sp.]|uniref:RNA polymerase sigma factor n=1 Tax=Oricola sp. TaxID=1979950 RepID=UPI003BACEC0C